MPSWSDPLWLGAYLGFYPGMVLLGRERFARRGVGMWLDGLLGGLALGAVTAATALQASLSNLDAAGSAAVTGAAYPLADIALLTFLATMFAGSSWRPSYSGLALVAGLLVLVGVDTTYAIDSAHGGWFAGGTYDPRVGPAMLVLAAAAWLPVAPRAGHGQRASAGLMFPSAFAAIAVARARLRPDRAPEPGRGRARRARTATVMVRMALLLRETATLAVSRKLSLTDDLTGLANRRAFTAEAERAVADERPFALLMIDLDEFKELNDTLGHHVGDELLRSVGPRLSATMRAGDVARPPRRRRVRRARHGRRRRDGRASAAGRACARRSGAPSRSPGSRCTSAPSIGIALFPEHAAGREDAAAPRRRRDVRGQARAPGPRGLRLRARSPQPRPPRAGRRAAPRARPTTSSTLHYQPKADLATGRAASASRRSCAGATPSAGCSRPAPSCPLVEHTELMRELSRRRAGDGDLPGRRLASAWSARGGWRSTCRPPTCSTARCSTTSPRCCAATARRPARLTLEVTESVAHDRPRPRHARCSASCAALGVQLALDDFGTG